MRLKGFKLAFVWTLMTGPLMAQFTLSGTIVDAESGNPISKAEVYDRNSSQLTSTSRSGYFEIHNLEPGNHQIVVMSLEYQTLESEIVLNGDREITIPMEVFQQELSEVVISRKREEIFALNRLQPVEGTAIYAGKKSEVVLLDQMVGNAATNNARQIYSQVVGLNIYESIDAGLQLNVGGRGLDPNRTSNFNTRQNGYDISADVLGYPESYYTPPAEALSEIQVVRGAASLQYGTQFGGLINFKMKQPADKPIELVSRQSVGSFGLFNSFNSLSGTMGNFSYYTYFNYKTGDGFRSNAGFDSKNYFGSFGYAFSERTSATLEFTSLNYLAQQPGGLTDPWFQSDSAYTVSNRSRNWFEVNWKLYALKLEHKLTTRTDLSLTLFGLDAERNAVGFRGDPRELNANPITQEDEQEPNGSYVYSRDLIRGQFQNWGAEARFLTRYALGRKDAVLLLGSKYYHANNTSRQGPGSRGTGADFDFTLEENPNYVNQSDFEFPNRNLAIFGENILFINDRLSITPGFRYEFIRTASKGTYNVEDIDLARNVTPLGDSTDNRTFERSFVLLGIGLSYSPSDNFELYANVSENYRSVTFSDIRITNPTFSIDPNISDEEGYTFDMGIRGKWHELISYDVGLFSMLYKNRIGVIFDDRAKRVRGNIGDALIIGLEFFADVNLAKPIKLPTDTYKLNLFVNAAATESEYLQSDDNNVAGKKVEFIPQVNMKTGLRFGYRNLLGSFQFTYLSEQYTDVENSPIPDGSNNRNGLIGEIPAYSIMDLSLSYVIDRFKIETGVNNLLDEKYFTRRATGYPGPGIIPSEPRNYYLTLQLKL
ncbi:Fe(3+) dicitrate transport protein [Ekhidna lutea]|uniref:Fe(3+) dicitrate transport protein n=1 Tax=Ekhidna lutea TaxID=447679 RepID=A0A239F7G4_EKHLU|nr:TonB-dependent receptor [Ekhidna lutea]SNS52747.1 Fe(3+) dicitrate transport protein [Ekhidna lutea]